MNRRIVVVLFGLAATLNAQRPITAREVIERRQKNVGVPWRAQTMDTFKAGDPEKPVTGIATTMMATFDVLRRAAASGKNLVITREPTFYGHQDQIDELERENDRVFAAKEAFIKEHHMVVWRFHDHWHAHRPAGITKGMVRALGWQKYQSAENSGYSRFPRLRFRTLRATSRSGLVFGRFVWSATRGYGSRRSVLIQARRESPASVTCFSATMWRRW